MPSRQRSASLSKKRSAIEDDENLIPVYQDEVHFQAQATVCAAWYKKGSAPKVKSLPERDNVSYSGFVRPDTGELFMCKPSWFNYETTIACFREYISANPIAEGKKYVFIVDNAPWHKKAVRLIEDEKNSEYEDIRERATFVKLPPYSPDLNPIEQVWRITRRENTHNVYFSSRRVLEAAVDAAFAKWTAPNEQLRALCSFKRKY